MPKPNRKKKVAEQMEFDNHEWKKFLTTPLGTALSAFVATKQSMEDAKGDLDQKNDLVMIEMKKAGKDFIKPQIDGVFYEFSLDKQEKLKFKRSK